VTADNAPTQAQQPLLCLRGAKKTFVPVQALTCMGPRTPWAGAQGSAAPASAGEELS